MKNVQRFEFLDGLRGIAALVVVVFHFSDQYGHAAIFSSAPLAVDLFFCLSGFVIAWSYYQRLLEGMSYLNYFKRRLIRLYPMFIIGLIVGLISYVIKLNFGHTPYTPFQILKSNLFNLFYLPYFVDPTQSGVHGVFLTNPPAWSLFFEMLANLIFIFTIRFSKLQLIFVVLTCAAWLIVETYFLRDWPGWSTTNFIGGFPRVGFSFTAGVLIFKYYDKVQRLPSISPLVLISALLIIFIFPLHKSVLYWLFCALFIMPLFVMMGSRVTLNNFWLEKTVLWLGWISYPIYCLHNPMLNIYKGLVGIPTHFYRDISVLFMITIAITFLIAKYLDDPIRAWLVKR